MKLAWKNLSALVLMLGVVCTAGATVVTFEDTGLSGSGGLYLGKPDDGYGGISGWSSLGNWQGVYESWGDGVGDYLLYSQDQLSLSFDAAPVVFQGTYFKSYATDYSAGAPVAIELYFHGALVHSILDRPLGGALEWLASGYSGLVDGIVLRGGGEGFGIDNLTYQVSAVPLPAAWLLFSGSGAALLGLGRRRKKMAPPTAGLQPLLASH